MTFHYSSSPFFAGIRSNLYMNDIKIDRSFSTFSYNNRYFELKKSKFFNFLDPIINIDKNAIEFNGNFSQGISFKGIGSNVNVIDSLFYNISSNSIIQNNDDYITICIYNSQFVNSDDIEIKGNAIDLQGGASLFVNSLCFYNLVFDSLLKVKVSLLNKIQLNQSTILKTRSRNSLIDCTNCSFDVHNLNFTDNNQNGNLMVFNSINYFYIDFLNLMKSIDNKGFLFTNHIDLANFTFINVNNYERKNAFIFYLEKGSIYVYSSSFSIDSKLIFVESSTAFFYRCNASVKYNFMSYNRMIWSIACSETVPPNLLLTANPDSFIPLLYCKDGLYPVLNDSLMIDEIRIKSENVQVKGATEILGILLLSVLSVCIVALSIWLILYFVVFKNPLREFEDDDEMAKWKQRWDWILTNTNKASIEHAECSDMELDPIELSDDAIKRRHQKLYEDMNQFSESDKIVNEDFGGESIKEQKKIPKKNKTNEEDEIKSKGVLDDFDSQNSFKEDDEGEDFDDAYKTTNRKTVTFQNGAFNSPDKKKSGGKGEAETEDDLSKKKKESKKSKSLKIHFLSSDEDEKGKEEDESSGIISESDDMDVDNDKINDDLEKTKSAWNRIQKAKIDKSLGTVDESSESSWGFIHKNLKLTLNPTDEPSDSANIWSDDDKVEKKMKDKNKKDKHDDDDDYDGYGYDDEADDDDDIWSYHGDDEGDDDDDKSDAK